MLRTFDRSPTLSLALVAQEDLSEAAYVPIEAAPAERGSVALTYLRQLHAVANMVPDGLVARERMALVATSWEMLGGGNGNGRVSPAAPMA